MGSFTNKFSLANKWLLFRSIIQPWRKLKLASTLTSKSAFAFTARTSFHGGEKAEYASEKAFSGGDYRFKMRHVVQIAWVFISRIALSLLLRQFSYESLLFPAENKAP